MNWLGDIIQEHVTKEDTVLDIGCGIMQATTDILGTPGNEGNLECRVIVGVDLYPKYLDRVKDRYPTVRAKATQTELFVDKSFDVVICLDLLEHLPSKEEARKLLQEMKRIARKKVIAYTPKEFDTNEDHAHESWGLGENPLQEHHILLDQDEIRSFGYEVTTTDIDHNTLAIYTSPDNKTLEKEKPRSLWNKFIKR